LLALAIALPASGMLIAFVLGGRAAERAAVVSLGLGLVLALMIALGVQRQGAPLTAVLGGWEPPLGLALRADGLAAAMLLTAALVLLAVALFGRETYRMVGDAAETRAGFTFWVFTPALSAGLAAAFLGGDLFNLFVALEMLTFAALTLACLDGRPSQFKSELRYLLFALIGSVLYLLGTALLYGAYGTLDIALLSGMTRADAATMLAGALMTAGLLAKMALFPLHLWLPSAHAGAPPPASALLSGLVVKASFVLLLRLWFWVMPAPLLGAVAPLLAALGAAAILFGSLVALRQARLKLLVAYSTVAQIGYLFLMFPLVMAGGPGAWLGGILQAVSHAFAKAAMFLAAGLIVRSLGHDRVEALAGAARALPMTMVGFVIAGLSLMGVPPSGGFTAKWLLLRASLETAQWWWSIVILSGGLLTGGYVYRVVASALARDDGGAAMQVPLRLEAIVLALALVSLILGMLPLSSLGIVQIGRLAVAP
jgi:formate hydrogenlyase subunit 3/multisubunit Na+/H+ antiporter MnhD subunit